MNNEILSFRATVTVLRDFMEVAFHTILYLRQIYPAQLFEQTKKYGVPVWSSRNPALNQYIGGVTEAISEELLKGTLKQVALVVRDATSGEQVPLERFIFDFNWLVSTQRIGDTNSKDFTPDSGGMPRAHIDDHLRGFLQKLNTGESYLLQLPPDVTFAIVIEQIEDAPPPETAKSRNEISPAQWIPAEARVSTQQVYDSNTDSIDDAPRKLTPLRGVRLGIINMQLLVEEYEAKVTISMQRDALKSAKGKGRESESGSLLHC